MALTKLHEKLFENSGTGSAINHDTLPTTDQIPNQSGHSGEYLTTNGSATSWGEVDLSSKQDVISDLATIRSGAAAGATAQQPATTLAGYGITDAKIASGVITLGSNTITPLTSHQDISGKANLSGAQMTGGFKEAVVAMSANDINLSSGNCFTKTISADTTFTISNAGTCTCFCLVLTNGGAYTLTWPSSMRWASGTPPTLTSSGVDVLTFVTPNSGSIWYGIPSVIDAQAAS